jgi:hypothetical protein
MLYAVHYRNMHTAIHHYCVFEDRDVALAAASAWKEQECFDEFDESLYPSVDDFEIHWQHPPANHPKWGDRLEVVNRCFDMW